jgi:hypothetical protein
MINRESSKYVNLFINKTFNNFFWKSVIYDFDCNDSFIYNLNRFVNKITFAHEMIDTSNDFMLIEEYEIMFVINRIHLQNRKTIANALQNRQSRQLIISSCQSWEFMFRLFDNSEIEQSSSAATVAAALKSLVTVAAAQSIQITRYSSFCTSISFNEFIQSVHTQSVHSLSSFTQFTHSVHSLSSLTQFI